MRGPSLLTLAVLFALVLAVLHASCDPAAPAAGGGLGFVDGMAGLTSASAAHRPPAPRPMLVEITRDFCLPCQVMAPAVAELRQQYQNEIDVVVVNVDRAQNHELGRFFQARTVPALVFVAPSGEIVARRQGVTAKKEMEATLRRLGWIR
ncbi:MAG: thioredoxin family protein [Myxococcota bacterium]